MKIRIDKADSVFSQCIRLRDKNKCQKCGKKGTQNSHFYGRRYESTRFEPDNCMTICFSCHRFFHENPVEQVEFMKKRLGEKRFDSLLLQANGYCKRDRSMRLLEATAWLKILEGEV